jgi:hypothetical protein
MSKKPGVYCRRSAEEGKAMLISDEVLEKYGQIYVYHMIGPDVANRDLELGQVDLTEFHPAITFEEFLRKCFNGSWLDLVDLKKKESRPLVANG